MIRSTESELLQETPLALDPLQLKDELNQSVNTLLGPRLKTGRLFINL